MQEVVEQDHGKTVQVIQIQEEPEEQVVAEQELMQVLTLDQQELLIPVEVVEVEAV